MSDLETTLCNHWRTLNFNLSLLKTRHTEYQRLAVKKIMDISRAISEMGNDVYFDNSMDELIGDGVDYYRREYPWSYFKFLADMVFEKFWQRALEIQKSDEAKRRAHEIYTDLKTKRYPLAG